VIQRFPVFLTTSGRWRRSPGRHGGHAPALVFRSTASPPAVRSGEPLTNLGLGDRQYDAITYQHEHVGWDCYRNGANSDGPLELANEDGQTILICACREHLSNLLAVRREDGKADSAFGRGRWLRRRHGSFIVRGRWHWCERARYDGEARDQQNETAGSAHIQSLSLHFEGDLETTNLLDAIGSDPDVA